MCVDQTRHGEQARGVQNVASGRRGLTAGIGYRYDSAGFNPDVNPGTNFVRSYEQVTTLDQNGSLTMNLRTRLYRGTLLKGSVDQVRMFKILNTVLYRGRA